MASSDRPPNESWNDPETLWKLAQKVEERQLWAGYLSEQEHGIWRKAIRRRETWNEFLEGRGEAIEMGESQDGGGSASGNKDGENGEKVADPVSIAFRARDMLFDFSVNRLFPPSNAEDMMFDVDAVSGEDEAATTTLEEPEKPKTRDIEEDDYDDDEEDAAVAVVVPEPPSQNEDTSLDNIGMSQSTQTDDR
jgi:hypothetical protein